MGIREWIRNWLSDDRVKMARETAMAWEQRAADLEHALNMAKTEADEMRKLITRLYSDLYLARKAAGIGEKSNQALRCIVTMETPRANATVKRMVAIAREALGNSAP